MAPSNDHSLPPRSAIQDYLQDEDGLWVAALACGHRQHLRHEPPWQVRPWVLTEEGRRAHLGLDLECPLCAMAPLPPDLVVYKTLGPFTETTVPKGLLGSHRLKAEAWGRIVVEAGYVLYVLEAPTHVALMLRPGTDGLIEPQRPHHVEPQSGARFTVQLLRRDRKA